jgi:hypothetical protein
MHARHPVVCVMILALACALVPCMPALAQAQDVARGVVYHDQNGNEAQDAGEPGVPGVAVSNGLEVVLTDAQGRYELPVGDDTILFIIKPSGWMTPVSADQLPRFYYIHKPAGSPADLKYPGVAPTGPLPDSVDFALTPQEEPDTFSMIVLADPQPHTLREVDYVARDIVEELVRDNAHGAAFGTTLGDIVGDNLAMFEPLNGAIGRVGIPWYNVIGNHDLNQDHRGPKDSTETYQRVYGPPYYAWNHGKVHFIALDSIQWRNDGVKYIGWFDEEQMAFVRNNLALVPEDRLVVVLMHISLVHDHDEPPGYAVDNPEVLYDALKNHPHSFSMSGHWHNMSHYFIGRDAGWHHDTPHHHFVVGTAGGSWWSGHHDEFGIPHATMDDGKPNGYAIVTFEGNQYRFVYKAARRPLADQMNIYAPDEVASAKAGDTLVVANVFAGSPKSTVEMRLDGHGGWVTMERFIALDPNHSRLHALNDLIPEELGRGVTGTYDHETFTSLYSLWRAPLPAGLPAGTHAIRVRSTDMFGQVHHGARIIRVME